MQHFFAITPYCSCNTVIIFSIERNYTLSKFVCILTIFTGQEILAISVITPINCDFFFFAITPCRLCNIFIQFHEPGRS
jgi:hypothetical protein